MKRDCARKSARGGRALLTGLMRCGRCGRMMRAFCGMGKGHAHRGISVVATMCMCGPDCVSGPAAFESIVPSQPPFSPRTGSSGRRTKSSRRRQDPPADEMFG